MKTKWRIMALMSLAGFSNIASSEAVTGKIMIDGQVYSSGSANVIRGSGNIVTNKRKLSAFNNLSINITADIEYIASDSYQLELTVDDNIAPTITTTISGNTLSIDTNRSFSTQNTIRARIYGSPALRGVIMNGSSDVNLQEITGNSLEINLEGTGDLKAQGNVQNLNIKVSGSGNVNTKGLQADNVTITVDGSADVTVTANNKLNVSIDGVSDVTYYGHPGAIYKTIDGVGDISAGD